MKNFLILFILLISCCEIISNINFADNVSSSSLLNSSISSSFISSTSQNSSYNSGVVSLPTITILSPIIEGGVLTTNSSFIRVSGNANVETGFIDKIYVIINESNTNIANGTTNWSIDLQLLPSCDNYIYAYSIDNFGNKSVVKYIVVKTFNTTEIFEQIFDNQKIHSITLEFSISEWNNLLNDFDKSPGHGINQFYPNCGRSEIKRKGNFIFKLNGTGSEERINDVGIKLSGNTSRVRPYDYGYYQRCHFFVDFNYTFEENEGYYYGSSDISPITNNRGRRFAGILRGLKLKMEFSDPNLCLENYCYDLFRNAGVPAPRTSFARLYIKIGNNVPLYYGIYKLIEPVDESFLNRNFGKRNTAPYYGELYKCLYQDYQNGATLTLDSLNASSFSGNTLPPYGTEITEPPYGALVYRPSYDLKNPPTSNYPHTNLLNFISNLNLKSGSDFINWIERNFDVTNFIKFLAINVLTGMSDDYWVNGNNYYLYYNIISGKWIFIPYDYDNTFGLLNLYDALNKNIDNFGPFDNSRPLVYKILSILSYKKLYHDFITNYIVNYFNIEKANQFMSIKNNFDLDWNAIPLKPVNLNFNFESYINNRIQSICNYLGITLNTTNNYDPFPNLILLTNNMVISSNIYGKSELYCHDYKIYLNINQKPYIVLTNLTANFSLKLYDQNNNQLSYSGNSGWDCEYITNYIATYTGYYIVRVYISGSAAEDSGYYKLLFSIK